MKLTTTYTCMSIRQDGMGNLDGIGTLMVDDSLAIGNKSFFEKEEVSSLTFEENQGSIPL